MSKKSGANRNCENCGAEFYVPAWQAKMFDNTGGKYCTKKCLWEANSKRERPPNGIIKRCEYIDLDGVQCSQEFFVPSYRIKTAKFCSRRCTSLAYAPDREEARLKATVKHGHALKDFGSANPNKRSHTPEYRTWMSMKRRIKFQVSYIQRGIQICDRWLKGEDGKHPFVCFLEDMGEKPSPNHSLDRHPNAAGNYEPTNCRWATDAEQGWSKVGLKHTEETRNQRSIAMRGNKNRLGHKPNITDEMREKCRQAALKQHAEGRANDPDYRRTRTGGYKKCENCGTEFYVQPYQLKDPTVRFCCKEHRDSGFLWMNNGQIEMKLWPYTPRPDGRSKKWRPGRLRSSTPGRPRKDG